MTNFLAVSFLFFISLSTMGHGEDQPGPNGGAIRMPGAYHTELVVRGEQKIEIFLLDINFKNPTIQDSSVEVSFKGQKKATAECEKTTNSFLCTFKQKVDLKEKGKIIVNSQREKQKGNSAEYVTPLN